MPTYDYHCHANGRVVEVRHRMSEQVGTWGELCALAGIALDGTAADAPVERRPGGAGVVRNEHLGSGVAPACGSPGPACSGACGYRA